jgi:lipoprotein NlpI
MSQHLFSAILVVIFTAAPLAQSRIETIFQQATDDLQKGRITEAVAGFDAVVRMDADVAPQLWQRGIALYFAGRYLDCRKQFELHRTVNPNDVENAAWHFLCAAKAESPSKAQERLLPVGADMRAPMAEIYEMFAGRLAPDRVIAAAGGSGSAEFYAQLYVGLYFDAMGRRDEALNHLAIASSDRFARSGGYMHDMARIHLRHLR